MFIQKWVFFFLTICIKKTDKTEISENQFHKKQIKNHLTMHEYEFL